MMAAETYQYAKECLKNGKDAKMRMPTSEII